MKDLKIARHRYGVHKAGAKARNIDFTLTFEEWYSWWKENGVDKNIPNSSLLGDQPCMSRYEDSGSYSLDNIYYSTRSENVAYSRKNKGYVTRSGHFKPVKTPEGLFESRTAAAKYFDVAEKTITNWVKKRPTEFSYES